MSESKLAIYLRDIAPGMGEEWEKKFAGCPDVTVSTGDIFQDAPFGSALVSPANSYGFMDGGIDLVYSRRFGWNLQRRLQQVIEARHDGELLVGDAEVVATHDPLHPFLISAPTMRVPMQVMGTANAYLAFRAVLRAVTNHNSKVPPACPSRIRAVVCPGLGTATGGLPFRICAAQMFAAYSAWNGNRPTVNGISECITNHVALIAGH